MNENSENIKPSINQSVDFNRLLTMDWDLYENIEINPCSAWDKDNKSLPWESIDLADHIEMTDENNEYISLYSVYLRKKEGDLDNIADFKDKPEAEQFAKFILEKFLPHAKKTFA